MKDKEKTADKDLIRDCGEIRPLLFDYMNHELGPGRSDLVREHLRKCKACQAESADIQTTLELLKTDSKSSTRAPDRLTDDRRKRITWSLGHPMLAWINSHHVLVSVIIVLLIILAAIFLVPPPVAELPQYETIYPMIRVSDGGTNYHWRNMTEQELQELQRSSPTGITIRGRRVPRRPRPVPKGGAQSEVMKSPLSPPVLPPESGEFPKENTNFPAEAPK